MDRTELAAFVRARREALHPEDVGLSRGPRRRTPGLRREEVAALAGMSADYLNRLEQGRGSRPSEQMIAALARALRLDTAERDHMFRLAGWSAPERAGTANHVSSGMARILDRLQDTPAQVMSELGEVLVQTPLARTLLGDRTIAVGLARSTVYGWFTDLRTREVYPAEDRPERGRQFVGELRAAYARLGRSSRAGAIVQSLLASSPEFAEVWNRRDVTEKHAIRKRLQHPEVGVMTLDCQTLLDTETQQRLLVFTARPGTEDEQKLALLSVIGTQALAAR